MSTFVRNKALVNAKFEGYRLDALSQDDVVRRYNLEYRPTQAAVSGRTFLSFEEVQSRIRHNHLAVGGGTAVYIDDGLRVILVQIDTTSLIPSFRVVFEMPQPIATPSSETSHREYPSVALLGSNVCFVSDGYGAMYVLNIEGNGTAQFLGAYELIIPPTLEYPTTNTPFRIHYAVQSGPDTVTVIVSSKNQSKKGSDTSDVSPQSVRGRLSHTEFDIWAADFVLPMMESDGIQPMRIRWYRRGEDVPILAAYDLSREAFLLAGSSLYREIGAATLPSEPVDVEMAPIPRPGDTLDGWKDLPRPPPYSWTQTEDSVTIAFALPSTTLKSDIKVAFSSQTITVLVQGKHHDTIPLPSYSLKTLWDRIKPSPCLWTWDREANHAFGLLTLHLDKQHEGTRWSHVFAGAGTVPSSQASPEDVEVPETLDPSELVNIREALEKYTAAIRDGSDSIGLGLGDGVPSLGKDEMDDEVDASVGRSALLTWVASDGSTPPWSEKEHDTSVTVLSTPFPGKHEISLVTKNGLDGLFFTLPQQSPTRSSPDWIHSSTFSALAFVLASKRDTRFTYHSSQTVLAFESGSSAYGGNVYIYRGAGVSDNWAKQAVLKISGGASGALLGVAVMRDSDGRDVIMCLCESEWIMLQKVI
ncbi:hypothetical protein JAAARDRAFT_459575 [Jaapia argillacea MUCL 33604]|uniref:NudC domain-containing protein 1 n=1 Tax=Jaapia argillacea MUCL 33604 TaxID=933084 RepID=A0A067QIL0_9AGAM|nr:hypothetical protein JAAARDRAFT_459575 [Jaapia argillacea MUCL 33604]